MSDPAESPIGMDFPRTRRPHRPEQLNLNSYPQGMVPGCATVGGLCNRLRGGGAHHPVNGGLCFLRHGPTESGSEESPTC